MIEFLCYLAGAVLILAILWYLKKNTSIFMSLGNLLDDIIDILT